MFLVAVLLFIKEMAMGLMGLSLLDKGGKVFSAKWYGKVCTAIVDVSMVFLFISPIIFDGNPPQTVCNILIYTCMIVLVVTSFLYTRLFAEKIKEADAQNKKAG